MYNKKLVNVNIVLEYRFDIYKNQLYSKGGFPQSFWDRYLRVFDTVTIIARSRQVDEISPNDILISNDKVKFIAIPYYIGIMGRIKKHFKIVSVLKTLSNDKKSAFILRVGSPIADILAPLLQKRNVKYAVEVVGDPFDVFAPGAIQIPLRPFFRLYFSYKLKKQCANASFSSYVTEKALQNRYPPLKSIESINASSIDLHKEFFFKRELAEAKIKRWLFVGTLEQYQKAPDILIKAFALLKDRNIELTIVGDGRKRKDLEELCLKLELENITFVGNLKTSLEVRDYLMSHSFFVLPSRGEGLPRAMIEAMACSCVCVGSDIGGIKELISDEFIVGVGKVRPLALKIEEYSNKSIQELQCISNKNYDLAHEYLYNTLENRRDYFYNCIKNELLTR
jgi:glycosyltransferase involved in cell wall biosynthesis